MEESWAPETHALRLRLDAGLWQRLRQVSARRRVTPASAAARMLERQVALEEAGLTSQRTVQAATLATLFAAEQVLSLLEALLPAGAERSQQLSAQSAGRARERVRRVLSSLAEEEADWRA